MLKYDLLVVRIYGAGVHSGERKICVANPGKQVL